MLSVPQAKKKYTVLCDMQRIFPSQILTAPNLFVITTKVRHIIYISWLSPHKIYIQHKRIWDKNMYLQFKLYLSAFIFITFSTSDNQDKLQMSKVMYRVIRNNVSFKIFYLWNSKDPPPPLKNQATGMNTSKIIFWYPTEVQRVLCLWFCVHQSCALLQRIRMQPSNGITCRF
jgi:hypothetical protein